MKLFQNLTKHNRAFLIYLPLAVIVAGGVLYFSSRAANLQEKCGCGLPSVDATGQYDSHDKVAVFNNQSIDYKLAELIPSPESLVGQSGAILGATTDERWIEVDLSKQRLYAHNGDKIDYEFLISSGKWAPTPTGEFRIWTKLRYTKMEGGHKESHTYYYLPNVPYTQYFTSTGVGLHGTYWHNNFGQPMSHGCVNLSTLDAEKLFYWTSPVMEPGQSIVYSSKDNPGTKVVVHN